MELVDDYGKPVIAPSCTGKWIFLHIRTTYFYFHQGGNGNQTQDLSVVLQLEHSLFKLMGDTHKLENICPNYVTYKKSENAMS